MFALIVTIQVLTHLPAFKVEPAASKAKSSACRRQRFLHTCTQIDLDGFSISALWAEISKVPAPVRSLNSLARDVLGFVVLR